jgi:peroxiredoxin
MACAEKGILVGPFCPVREKDMLWTHTSLDRHLRPRDDDGSARPSHEELSMRARPTGALRAAGATSLVVLLAACGGGSSGKSSALDDASPQAAATSSASSAPGASRTPGAKPGQTSAPTSAATRDASTRTVAAGGPPTIGPAPSASSAATTRALGVSTKCRKPASSVGSGVALPKTKPAPFTATTTDCSGTLDFAAYTNGKPTLVTFFASWCEPCHKEAKDLEAVYEEFHASKGFQVIGVDTQDESGSPSWFYTDAKWTFPSVWDDGEKIEKAWNQSGATSTLPASFWIHPDGTISSIHAGAMTRSQMEDEFNNL